MRDRDIKSEIRKELENLNIKEIIHFAFCCAMYSLPLMGMNGNFSFWEKKERQKNIYAIFTALDFTSYAANTASTASTAYASYINVAANAANTAYAPYAAAYAASYAAYAAAYAANAANASYTNAAADAATDAAYAAYKAAANAGMIKSELGLMDILLKELKNIKSKKKAALSKEIYGKIWYNFKIALENERCGYWWLVFENSIKTGFMVDQESLKRRLNVPNEIKKQGAAAVANYLLELKKGSLRLNEARIIILGDKGAGKTCLARRLIDINAPMTKDDESTAGVTRTIWNFDDIKIHIWDFAGHTVTHAVHQFFLSERCLYILVYDGRTEERNRLEYWLNHMKNYGGDSRAIIVINKRDQHSVDIKINTLIEKYSIEGVYTFSIRDDIKDLDDFKNKVAGYIKNNPSWAKQEIPESYFHVKDELEKIFNKNDKENGQEHITKDEFDLVAKKFDVKDTDKLLQDLHQLGVGLWYSEMEEFDTLVLNPEWISYGVYRIINWVNESKKYSISIDDFKNVFCKEEKRYPEKKHSFLAKLMKYYELAYETKGKKELIIPHLLKEDRPGLGKLPDFPVGESLMLRYKAEQPLPPNTISRFIVRYNKQIKKDNNEYLVWRYGVVLKNDEGDIALVREEDRTISVSVKGNDKKNYISELRETLNDIFNSYKSQKPELQYRVERYGKFPDGLEETYPLWLPDRKILKQSNDNIPYYEDISGQQIDLNYTVKNYNITAENLMLEGRANQFIADKSTHNNFNFYSCNIGLQGNLNDLAQVLSEKGKNEESEQIGNAAKALAQAENCKTGDEVIKKGVVNKLKRLLEDLGDEDSRLHKAVKGVKEGIGIAQDIAKCYNDIAQWVGLPQVPKPFLKSER